MQRELQIVDSRSDLEVGNHESGLNIQYTMCAIAAEGHI